jgi:hypothetical protein
MSEERLAVRHPMSVHFAEHLAAKSALLFVVVAHDLASAARWNSGPGRRRHRRAFRPAIGPDTESAIIGQFETSSKLVAWQLSLN